MAVRLSVLHAGRPLRPERFLLWGPPSCYNRRWIVNSRDSGRKGESQIWDSRIWSRVPRDSDPRKTTLARTSSMYKRQIRPLIREGAPEKQDHNCQRVINIWWGSTPRLTDWLTVSRNVTLTLTWLREIQSQENSEGSSVIEVLTR
jgi:hypothetical protein